MFVNTKGKSPSPMVRFKNYLVWLDLVQPLFFYNAIVAYSGRKFRCYSTKNK